MADPPSPPVGRQVARKVAPVNSRTTIASSESKFSKIERPSMAEGAAPERIPPLPDDAAGILKHLAKFGFIERPYDETDEINAKDPINSTPQFHDAGTYWDYWMVIPSCDTLLSFSGAPKQNTPTTKANVPFAVSRRARRIYYVAATAATGTLSVWVARWNRE